MKNDLSSLQVPLNIPAGFPILSITAEDKDINSKIIYRIKNDNTIFSIDKSSGTISVIKPISERNSGSYTIQIEASDGIHASSATAEINLYDVDSNFSSV